MKWSPGRRVAIAIGVSTVMVIVLASLFPRIYLANDDIGFTEYLRKNTFTPWISPFLARSFGYAYEQAPGLPWFGLYQYALIIATGAALIHTCIELVDPRPGIGRLATLIGAAIVGLSQAILVIGITWTTVSIGALGTALASFVAYALGCRATGTKVSRTRALVYGLLFANGYMLRLQGLGAAVVALFPLLVWAAWRCLRMRYLPRPSALLAFVAPFAFVFVAQDHVQLAQTDQMKWFDTFNNERGKINGHAAFEGLDTRAPELLARAGWTLDEYRDFTHWLIIDERDYPIEKVERLVATGGVPEALTAQWGYHQLRIVFDDSAASVSLLATAMAGGIVLGLLGVVDRRRSLAFCAGYAVFLVAITLFMAANFRFPQRVSLTFFTDAALGVFIFLARAIADRDPQQRDAAATTARSRLIGALAVGVFALSWAWHLATWIDRAPTPYRDELQRFEDRVAARGGFVFVYVQTGLVEFDPLRAEPRSYDGLQGGWGTFSAAWYDTIHRLGAQRGRDVLPAMLGNASAYLLGPEGARPALEEWIRRKVGNPAVRLALVDRAAILGGGRPELWRVVTTPLIRGSDEWNMLEHDEHERASSLPGPPTDRSFAFHTIDLAPPTERLLSATHAGTTRIVVRPIDRGASCTVIDERSDDCRLIADDADAGVGVYGGIHVAIDGLGAARFQLRLVAPENIISVNVYARTETSRSIRWNWPLGEAAQRFGFSGSVTLVPDFAAHYFGLYVRSANPRDVRDLEIFIVVKPHTSAGFELRDLEVARP